MSHTKNFALAKEKVGVSGENRRNLRDGREGFLTPPPAFHRGARETQTRAADMERHRYAFQRPTWATGGIENETFVGPGHESGPS
jgi:hypothetical protein